MYFAGCYNFYVGLGNKSALPSRPVIIIKNSLLDKVRAGGLFFVVKRNSCMGFAFIDQ
jgi:hypothetical protein